MSYRRLAYYRGDPGFFGSLGKIVKGAGKVVGTVGKIGGKIGKLVPGIGTAISAIELGHEAGKALAGGPLRNIGLPRGVRVMPAGGNTGVVGPSMPGIGAIQTTGVSYRDVISGGSSTAPRRRYRRMNVTNFRALKRSMRRVKGFAKMAREAITFTKQVRMKSPKRRSR